jgi:hypothetical protein
MTSYLEKILQVGAGHVMDGLSIHPYPVTGDVGGGSAVGAVQEAEALLRRARQAGLPLWLTETGMSTTGVDAVTPQQQAYALTKLYQRLSAFARVKAIVFHTLFPPPAALGVQEPGFAVVARSGAPTPAFCALGRITGRHVC